MKINATIQTPKQIDITATTGTAPLKIASTTAIPNLNVDMVDGKHAADFAAASHTHTKSQISDLSLSTVATSGSYNDLLNKPVIPAAYTHPAYTTRTVSLDASGAEVIDTISLTSDASGHITAASASKRTLTLANLGYTGATNANYYTHPSGDGNLHVPATGTANNGKILKAGATAGSLSWGNLTYSDVGAAALSHTHTKSEITDFPTFAAVATSGSYADLLNKPTIPTKTSQLTNDSGYITGGAFLSTSGGTLTGNLNVNGDVYTKGIKQNGYNTLPSGNGSLDYWHSILDGTYFCTPNTVTGQPSDYGLIHKIGTSEFTCLWFSQMSGTIYRLSGNGNSMTGWIALSYADHNHDGSYVNVGGDTMSGNLTVPSVYTSNWFRSTGATGWYSETYGGGWYMSDSSWIRAYGSKPVYTPSKMQADAGFFVGSDAVVAYGSNSNGHYIRYYDGTQICWQRYDLGANIAFTSQITTAVWGGRSQMLTYPAAFIAAPAVGGGVQAPNYVCSQVAPNSSTQCYVRLWTNYSLVASMCIVHYVAVGRWK